MAPNFSQPVIVEIDPSSIGLPTIEEALEQQMVKPTGYGQRLGWSFDYGPAQDDPDYEEWLRFIDSKGGPPPNHPARLEYDRWKVRQTGIRLWRRMTVFVTKLLRGDYC